MADLLTNSEAADQWLNSANHLMRSYVKHKTQCEPVYQKLQAEHKANLTEVARLKESIEALREEQKGWNKEKESLVAEVEKQKQASKHSREHVRRWENHYLRLDAKSKDTAEQWRKKYEESEQERATLTIRISELEVERSQMIHDKRRDRLLQSKNEQAPTPGLYVKENTPSDIVLLSTPPLRFPSAMTPSPALSYVSLPALEQDPPSRQSNKSDRRRMETRAMLPPPPPALTPQSIFTGLANCLDRSAASSSASTLQQTGSENAPDSVNVRQQPGVAAPSHGHTLPRRPDVRNDNEAPDRPPHAAPAGQSSRREEPATNPQPNYSSAGGALSAATSTTLSRTPMDSGRDGRMQASATERTALSSLQRQASALTSTSGGGADVRTANAGIAGNWAYGPPPEAAESSRRAPTPEISRSQSRDESLQPANSNINYNAPRQRSPSPSPIPDRDEHEHDRASHTPRRPEKRRRIQSCISESVTDDKENENSEVEIVDEAGVSLITRMGMNYRVGRPAAPDVRPVRTRAQSRGVGRSSRDYSWERSRRSPPRAARRRR